MPFKFKKSSSTFHFGMKAKLTLAISSIVAILLMSSIISILEFRRMSNYVSDRISEDIECINLSTELAVSMDEYNVTILSIVGDADSIVISGLDPAPYLVPTDSIVAGLVERRLQYADSLAVAYEEYKQESFQLDSIIVSDFVDSRDWYFTVLQPQYNKFRKCQDKLNMGIHTALHSNSASFDESFYRSIMPGVVSVGVGILLALLLMFFLLVYYVKPLNKMLQGLDSYKRFSHPYNVVFEGDDQLQDLNGNISEVISENSVLKKRIRERER